MFYTNHKKHRCEYISAKHSKIAKEKGEGKKKEEEDLLHRSAVKIW